MLGLTVTFNARKGYIVDDDISRLQTDTMYRLCVNHRAPSLNVNVSAHYRVIKPRI